ncbi:MAG: hypothetical protein ABIV06_04740 [Thermoanaerobaculia bacterium]
MAGADGKPLPFAAGLLAGLTTLAISGCAATVPDAVALPPVSQAMAEAPPSKTAGEDVVASPAPPTVVVIDAGSMEGVEGPKNLADAAREERDRRAQAGKPVAVIDNRNLAEFAKGQKLTVAEGSGTTAADASAGKEVDAAAARAVQDEEYWRNRGLEIRQRWRTSTDRIVELEGESEELRRRFYAADDPYVRDSQVKPEWDRALDELDETRRAAERAELELERFLTEGRQAGAFPGWLRDGTDLEPERKVSKAPDGEPAEPVELEEPRDQP